MFGLGTQELIIILLIVVVLFGATRLPQIGSGIGQAIKNFKKGVREADEIDVTPKQESPEASKKEKIKKEESD
jgi:sec-independent protein translocase protein TatA